VGLSVLIFDLHTPRGIPKARDNIRKCRGRINQRGASSKIIVLPQSESQPSLPSSNQVPPMKLHVPLTLGLGLAHSFNLSSAGVCGDSESARMSFLDAVGKRDHPSKGHNFPGPRKLNGAVPPQSIVGGIEVSFESFVGLCSSIVMALSSHIAHLMPASTALSIICRPSPGAILTWQH
jgi:hypothetical protein